MPRLDYDSDDDPLGYMTTRYPSGAGYESGMDMTRRMMLRGRNARSTWQRVAVWTWILLALLGTVGGVLALAVWMLSTI